TAVQDAAQDSEVVNEGAGVVVLPVAGSYRLGIEVIGIDEVGVLRAEVKRRRDELFGGDDPIELSKGVEGLSPGLVIGKRQRANRIALKIIVNGGDEEESILDQGAVGHKTRIFIADAAHMKAADTEIRKRVIEIGMPLLAAALGLNRNDALCKAAILGQKRSLQYVDGLDAIQGNTLAKCAGCRIGDIGLVDDHGAAFLSRAVDFQFAFLVANHAGDERQRVI